MKNTLQFKLLTWFLAFSSITLTSLILFNYIYYSKKNSIAETVSDMNSIQVKILESFLLLDDFFALETSSEQFFITGKSHYLDSFRMNIESVKNKVEEIKLKSVVIDLDVINDLSSLSYSLSEYDKKLEEMLGLLIKRGFKDYGLEGEMREYVHILENFVEIDQAKVLSLRRHEKDYIIRNEEQYIEKLDNMSRVLRAEIVQSPSLTRKEKDSIVKVIDHYVLLFNQLVFLDREIGIKDNSSGRKLQLNQMSRVIKSQIHSLMSSLEQNKKRLFVQLEGLYLVVFGLLVLFSIFLSYRISKRITTPLSRLTEYISNLTKNNFKKTEEVVFSNPHYEIDVLKKEFDLMTHTINKREKERDNAEKALKESELKFRKLADMLPLSIFETDINGHFSYVNQSWLDSFGYTRNEVYNNMKLKDTLVITAKTVPQVDPVEGIDYIAITKGGQTFHSLVYSDRIVENGKEIGRRGVVIDIMERKKYLDELRRQKQKAEESDRLKSAFLANMSHEIRTPMNAIIGFSQLLSESDKTQKDRAEYIKHIQTSGGLLLNLIDDIIDIAKIESGVIKIIPRETSVNNILDHLEVSSSNILEREGKEKRIKLIKEIPILPQNHTIITDPHRLKQILGNLIGNAIKFTEAGHIKFGYKVAENEMIFFVADTGIGLSEDNSKVVFERFRQVEDGKNRKYGGTGLGLAICKNLVELLGGKIWLESELNNGSTFFFNIPLLNAPLKLFDPPIEDTLPANLNWSNKRMLIVEDEPTNARLIIDALKSTGIGYEWAKNGEEAVKKIEEEVDFDIVLMDIQMPVMNGYDATRLIKQKKSSLPVIAQTAAAMAGERKKAHEAGCDDYISKPLNLNLLKTKMYGLLKKNNRGEPILNEHCKPQINQVTNQ